MDEKQVGIRELKRRLSEYLRQVKAGETITITDYGKPIGRIIPIVSSIEERMAALGAAGLVIWDGAALRSIKPRAVNRGDRQLSDLIIEDRE